MITRKELEELIQAVGPGQKVLSLYVSTDLRTSPKEERRLTLRKLLERLGDDARADAEKVQEYFKRGFDWQCKGVALFSNVRVGLWREIRLAVPVPDYAEFEDKPNVRLLSDLMDEYPCYAIALVDRDHARFFVSQMGEIAEFTFDLPPTPGRQKQGGWSAARFQRHVEALALSNLKQAAQLVNSFYGAQHCTALLLAGTVDVLAQFRGLLPKALQKRVIDEFAMDIHAPAVVVQEKARAVQQQFERAREMEQVHALHAAARQRHPTAALGLADTLHALMKGQVRTLLAASDYQAGGFECTRCGLLSVASRPACPLCGSPLQAVDRMVDLAVRKAIECGSRVELIHGGAAAPLKELGGIGALLRF